MCDVYVCTSRVPLVNPGPDFPGNVVLETLSASKSRQEAVTALPDFVGNRRKRQRLLRRNFGHYFEYKRKPFPVVGHLRFYLLAIHRFPRIDANKFKKLVQSPRLLHSLNTVTKP